MQRLHFLGTCPKQSQAGLQTTDCGSWCVPEMAIVTRMRRWLCSIFKRAAQQGPAGALSLRYLSRRCACDGMTTDAALSASVDASSQVQASHDLDAVHAHSPGHRCILPYSCPASEAF
jgi:hypothetical protein